MTSLSILIPTAGRETLERTLESMFPQLKAGDEVLICMDTHGDAPGSGFNFDMDIRGARVWSITHDAGHHCWGHCQLNEGMKHATGDYLVFNDDDDVFTPNALESIRYALLGFSHKAPLLLRFLTHYRQVVWTTQEVAQGNLGGHNIVCPNVPDLLGAWGCHYEGDYSFVSETLDRWAAVGVAPVWRTDIIAVARPTEDMWRRMQAQLVTR